MLTNGPSPERDAFGRTLAEQSACGLHVLYGAFNLIVREGWCPLRAQDPTVIGREKPPPGLSLLQAMSEASEDSTMMAVEYARRLIRRHEYDFNRWENHPFRLKEEVLHLIRKAILLGGGVPPRMPSLHDPLTSVKRRGGWVVSR